MGTIPRPFRRTSPGTFLILALCVRGLNVGERSSEMQKWDVTPSHPSEPEFESPGVKFDFGHLIDRQIPQNTEKRVAPAEHGHNAAVPWGEDGSLAH